MSKLFKTLRDEIDKGREGKNGIIPFGLDRLNHFIDIAKNTMYCIGGSTGSGKSTLIHECFILKPLEWYFTNKGAVDIKLSIIYFGMERKLYMYLAKWISRMIFLDTGRTISFKKILSRKEHLTDEEYQIVLTYEQVMEEWEKDDILACYEGQQSTIAISKKLETFAEKHGTIEGNKYYSKHPNHIVLLISDHLGLLASGTEKKVQLDKFSEVMRKARDLYGFSPVIVQQLNRSQSDVQRLKLGDTLPKLSDFAETSNTANDSDVVLALNDPYRILGELGQIDTLGIDIKKLRDEKGVKYYRSCHILKNSFDSDGIGIPLGFHPLFGIFKSLPKNMTDADYYSVLKGDFFL